MRAAVIPEAGADFELVERPIPDPDSTEVRIEVDACGICHSDVFVKEGTVPGVSSPRTPGHEVVGRIDAVGTDVTAWTEGDRVGAGWHGGHCFTCEPCRRGDFLQCENAEITGLTFDGGYAEYATVPTEALAAVPDGLDAVDAAPLLCAGVTTYNALRNSDARPGDVVAVDVQHLVGTRGSVSGRGSGHARDSQDTLEFSDLRSITPVVERVDLDEVAAAYDRMVANDARFRAVLDV
ncbi:MAG: alcohol dehydrogenase catalytic domain-containing protein [Haloplanus sp.]